MEDKAEINRWLPVETLNKDWNLITRSIMPIINQPSPPSGISSAFGLVVHISAPRLGRAMTQRRIGTPVP